MTGPAAVVVLTLRYAKRTSQRVVNGDYWLNQARHAARTGRVLHMTAHERGAPLTGEPVWTWACTQAEEPPPPLKMHGGQLTALPWGGHVDLYAADTTHRLGEMPMAVALGLADAKRLHAWLGDWLRSRRVKP